MSPEQRAEVVATWRQQREQIDLAPMLKPKDVRAALAALKQQRQVSVDDTELAEALEEEFDLMEAALRRHLES